MSGQSSVDFIFNIVEAHEGAHSDFSLKEGRPLTGQWKRPTFKLSHFLQILIFSWRSPRQTYLPQSLALSFTLPLNTGGNISALLTVTGSETVSLTEVALIEGTGRTQVNGSLQVRVSPNSNLIIKAARQTQWFSCASLDGPLCFPPSRWETATFW